MAGDISTETTVLSNLSIDRNLSVATILGSPAITGGAITGSTLSLTGGASVATVGASSGISVGGGVLLTRLQKGTISIVTITVTGAVSSSTTAAVTGLTTADALFVMPPVTSGLSDGLVVQARVSAAGVATIVFSNTTSASLVQAGPVNYPYFAARS